MSPSIPRPWGWVSLAASCFAAALGLAACGKPEPVRLGFLGTLTRGASDVGEAGRNGVMLAVEQRNAAGGVNGRPIELLVEDDGQSPVKAAEAFKALVAAQAEVVIGPFTSGIATVVVPLANEARLPMISPTVTSLDFFGKDDHFIRIHRTTRDNAGDYAAKLMERGLKRMAVAHDLRNKSFSQSWLTEFRAAYSALGGRLEAEVAFESGARTAYGDIIRALIERKPDGLLFIANAVDSVRLGQRARQESPEIALATAEWAASEALVELGGRSIDRMLVLQPYDRTDTSPRYLAFSTAFKARFKREPGYSAVAAYDAATVALDAMALRKDQRPLRELILANGPYQGLQQQIQFDRHGDTQRRIVFNEVRNGRFIPAP